MNTHVLMLATDYPPNLIGGVGQHTHQLTQHLPHHGVRCTLVVPAEVDAPTVAEFDGITVIQAPRVPVSSAFNVHNIVGVMRQNVELLAAANELADLGSVDLVHVQDFFPVDAGIALARRTKRPLVVTKHFVPIPRYEIENELALAEIAELESLVADKSAAWIGVSQHSVDYLERLSPQSSALRSVIHNGAEDPPSLEGSAADWKSRHGLSERPLIVLVGAISRRKGVDQLLRAAATLPPDLLPNLVFVGEGPQQREFSELAQGLQLGMHTRFVGQQPREGVHSWLRAADVVAVPSLEEALPLSMLEAMAHGRAVVATRVGEIPAVLEHGRNGLLVNPGNPGELASALLRLLSNEELRTEIGREAARDCAAHYSWSGAARKTADTYLRVRRGRSA